MQTVAPITQCAALDGARRIRTGRRLLGLVAGLAAIALALGAVLLGPSAAFGQADSSEITIHFVDEGIESPKNTLDRLRGRPRKPPVDPFTGSPGVARLLIAMPSDDDLEHKSREELQQEIFNQIQDFVNANKDATHFEVQLVERVSLVGYARDPIREDLAILFGIAAYGALAKEVVKLASARRVSVYGTVGSNGSILFARALDAWKGMANYVHQVTYVNGRASVDDVEATVKVLGAWKVRIIVNKRDFWAAFNSIGSIFDAKAVQALYHAVTVLVADKKSGKSFDNHDSTMTDPTAAFKVKQIFPDQEVDRGWMSMYDLNPFGMWSPPPGAITANPATGSQTAAHQSPPPPSSRDLEDMKHVAGDLDDITKDLNVASPAIPGKEFKQVNELMGYLKDFTDLAVALRRDIAEHRNPASQASYTQQQLAEIKLELITNPGRLQDLASFGWLSETTARNIGSFSFGASGIAEGVGTMVAQHSIENADAAEKVLDGIAATLWGYWALYRIPIPDPEMRWAVAQAFASASQMTAKGVRVMTLPMFEQITAKVTGRDRQLVALWEEAQKVRIAHGIRAESIEKFYGNGSILDTIGPDEMSQADARLGLTNQSFERRTVGHYRETCINGFCTSVDLDLSAEPPGSDTLRPPKLGIPLAPPICPPGEPGCGGGATVSDNHPPGCPPGDPECGGDAAASHNNPPCPPGDPRCGGGITASNSGGGRGAPPSLPDAGGGPLGGIRLDQPLTGAALRGVKIDEANGNIVLIGERDFLARGLNLRDFAMALWLVFGPRPQDPAFSLDPDDIRNPSGPWLHARYVPDLLQGRSFGAEMFAADLLLKELSFQVMLDPDGKLKEWRSAVRGFRSYAELAMENPDASSGQGQWSRFWIVSDQVTSRQAGHTLLFDARMAVKARRQEPDPNSPTGLRDIETDPASLEARWAQIATKLYDDLATESPAFARVREMAVAIGIVKSLKAAGAHVDLARVADLLNADHTATVAKINAISIGWQRHSETPFRERDRQGVQIATQELHMFGGVDLNVKTREIPDDKGDARGMDKAVETAFHLVGPGTDVVRFEYGGSRLEAVALPLLVKQ